MFCPKCGKENGEATKFCTNCGQKLKSAAAPVPNKENAAGQNTAVKKAAGNTAARIIGETKAQAKQAIMSTAGDMLQIHASDSPGEVILGEIGGISGKVSSILGPGRTFVNSLKSFFKGFANPRALISAAVMAAIWITLILLQDNDIENDFLDISRIVTFAEGGAGRSWIGFAGGILGQGVVAAALATLVTGGGLDILKGIPRIFSGKNFRKNTIGFYLLGIGLSMMLYQFFAGNATITEISAAVCAMLVSLRALGGRAGFLFSMLRSFTAGKTPNGQRFARTEKPQALFAGFSLGFAGAIPLSFVPEDVGFLSMLSMESNLLPLMIGGVFTLIGLLVSVLGLRTAKRAAAAVMAVMTLLGSEYFYGSISVRAGESFTLIPEYVRDYENMDPRDAPNSDLSSSNQGMLSWFLDYAFGDEGGEIVVDKTKKGYTIEIPDKDVSYFTGPFLKHTDYSPKVCSTTYSSEGFSLTAKGMKPEYEGSDTYLMEFTLDEPFRVSCDCYFIRGNNWSDSDFRVDYDSA
nr:zinc ribbon domain-containing protein [Lachnospiraceae bacterium]